MYPHSEPTLVLDPAMLMDSTLPDEEGSDYEYEYDENETETFYLNLDLTSSHGPIRPPRRRADLAMDSSSAAATPGLSSVSVHRPRSDENESALASTESDNSPADGLQILGLHTHNPVVSYQNQVFSCSWADQIGTELHFTHPEPEPQPTGPEPETAAARVVPLKLDKNVSLIAANSVKILGRRANLISSAGPVQHALYSGDALDMTGGATRKAGPQTNQALFLERLRSIKQARGETDTVRTVFSLKRAQNLEERLRGWARTEEQLAEIQQLNNAALQGNSDAIAELENIYNQLGAQDPASFEESLQQR
ncbi:hypothetical protein BDV38DRAFT_208545 [Aspergillus pseudotamarii]|uniref:Transcription factor TFIIIC triple barrel domain-containing protein n=1 Tax=Aspergillus pseudotamarii TaxID=132259 RepID=A0A5N6SEZ9_ASPPS|nr:uncharacterized protein BDV38DRAFT_208545 [Aspergillus pseudotamarii]KAE8132517.1 hypothetical protein BDV38DRAFT_208545 [Aspergillus pseudotamarii]